MNILIIEDDAAIRQELKLLLENALYQVTVLTEFHHVVEDILQMEPDLILLDVNLPQQSGFEICKSVRKTSDVPIIFLTSRTDSMDELSGMLQGGDDYITKPFQPPLLLAHIAAVLKRAKKADVPEKMICKGVELDVVRGCVKCQEQQVDLSKNELKILHYLFLHQGEIVPRIELVEYLVMQDFQFIFRQIHLLLLTLHTATDNIKFHTFTDHLLWYVCFFRPF